MKWFAQAWCRERWTGAEMQNNVLTPNPTYILPNQSDLSFQDVCNESLSKYLKDSFKQPVFYDVWQLIFSKLAHWKDGHKMAG